jgi:energy-converting hydrogenase Eha subunit A
MALSKLFAVRGFLAFLAFMELVNCLRSLLPSLFTLPHERLDESFIHKKIFSLVVLTTDTELLVAQLFGFYSALNAVVLVQTCLFLHHTPVYTLGITTLCIKTLFLLTQCFIYKTIDNSAGLQVPLLVTVLALAGLVLLPWLGGEEGRQVGAKLTENEELLRAMRFGKNRRRKEI